MKLTPAQLQEQLTNISEESFELHMELATLALLSAEAKLELMKDSKSGKEVDMKYDATENGKREAYLKIYLKGLSHKRTAIIQEIKSNGGNSW